MLKMHLGVRFPPPPRILAHSGTLGSATTPGCNGSATLAARAFSRRLEKVRKVRGLTPSNAAAEPSGNLGDRTIDGKRDCRRSGRPAHHLPPRPSGAPDSSGT